MSPLALIIIGALAYLAGTGWAAFLAAGTDVPLYKAPFYAGLLVAVGCAFAAAGAGS